MLLASFSPSTSERASALSNAYCLVKVLDWIVTYSFVSVAGVFKDSGVYALFALYNSFPSPPFISRKISTSLWHAIKILCLHSILNRCTRNCICTYNAISNVFTTNKQYSRCTFEIFIAFHGYYYGCFLFVCSFISIVLSLSFSHALHSILMPCSAVCYHLFGWLPLETFTFVATLSQPANSHSFSFLWHSKWNCILCFCVFRFQSFLFIIRCK